MMNSAILMATAIRQAKIACKLGEVPVGAVLTHRGQMIVASYNGVERLADATAHAEILAIRAASQILNSRYLDGCDIYVTLEPCPMCFYAISLARIRRIYFGAYDKRNGAVLSNKLHIDGCRPECYGGLEEAECGALLSEFFAGKRR